MAPPRWAVAGAVVFAVALVAIVAMVALSPDGGCAALVVTREMGAPGAVPLNESRVRDEAPQLAALMDRAATEGGAREGHARTAMAMHAYLDEATGGRQDLVGWGGAALRVHLAGC